MPIPPQYRPPGTLRSEEPCQTCQSSDFDHKFFRSDSQSRLGWTQVTANHLKRTDAVSALYSSGQKVIFFTSASGYLSATTSQYLFSASARPSKQTYQNQWPRDLSQSPGRLPAVDSELGPDGASVVRPRGKAHAACPSGCFPIHRWGVDMLERNDQFTHLQWSGMKRSAPTPIAEFMVPTPVLMAIIKRR